MIFFIVVAAGFAGFITGKHVQRGNDVSDFVLAFGTYFAQIKERPDLGNRNLNSILRGCLEELRRKSLLQRKVYRRIDAIGLSKAIVEQLRSGREMPYDADPWVTDVEKVANVIESSL